MPDIDLNLNENVVWVGAAGFSAHHDKVIILQDDYRSGMECQRCLDENHRTAHGREVSTIPCENCKGEGHYKKSEHVTVKCSQCEGQGWVICPDCGGKGGTLVMAEKTKGRPTTGTIVSIGPHVGDKCLMCRGTGFLGVPVPEGSSTPTLICSSCNGKGLTDSWKRGDKCIYPSFAGHAYDLVAVDKKGRTVPVVLLILREEEILSRMYGNLEYSQVKRSAALHTNA